MQVNLRILYLTQVRLDQPQGAARHVIAVVRELAKLGHSILLVAPSQAGLQIPGVESFEPRSPKPGLRMELAITEALPNLVRGFQPDVALVRLSPSGFVGPQLLRALRVPVVVELNGPTLDELLAAGRPPKLVQGLGLVLRLALRGVPIVAVSPTLARYAKTVFGSREVEVVENGADLDQAQPWDRQAARRHLGLPAEARILAFAGSFVPEQRFDLLFEVHRQLPGTLLVMAGGGAQAAQVDAYAREVGPDRARAMGVLSHADAIALLSAADLAVDVREGHLGMKSRELLALGRRFVIFDFEGVDNLARLYPGLQVVHAVREHSVVALRSALIRGLEAELQQGPVPEPARLLARAHLGWDRTARELAEILARAARPS